MEKTVTKMKSDFPLFDPENGSPARTYKDRVFRMIFKEKAHFLELYNAMHGTDYTDPEALTVTTLENAIYIGMENDVSFLLFDFLTLYEHQSTWNPNLPLRDLFYVSSIYSVLTKEERLHSSRLIKIPEPVFVVFYNGLKPVPERSTLRLSDAYEHPSENPALELVVQVLNINAGCNKELMEKCRILRDYSIFVSRIREYCGELSFSQAVEKAISTCVADNILKEFLLKEKAEVLSVSIFEYNAELEHKKTLEEGIEQGIQQGIEQGEKLLFIHLIKKKYARNCSPDAIADALEASPEQIREILSLIEQYPDAEEKKLCELWNR